MNLESKTYLLKIVSGSLLLTTLIILLIMAKDRSTKETPQTSRSEITTSATIVDSEGIEQMIDSIRTNPELTQSELLERLEMLEWKLRDLQRERMTPYETIRDFANDENSDADVDTDEETESVTNERSPVDLIDEALRDETVDIEWSEVAVEALYESLDNESTKGIEILNADCRSTYCRMDLAFDFDIPEKGFGTLGTNLPWNGELFVHIDDANSNEVVAYLARESYELPNFSE